MDRLRFGTSGIPLGMPGRNSVGAPAYVRSLGLEAMELLFVRSVNLSLEKAKELGKVASDNDVKLTCHGSYYVNLCSKDVEKVVASKKRILKAAEIANAAGATSVTFHAGFYQGVDADLVYEKIKKEMTDMVGWLKKRGNEIELRPETTGKGSQFGSVGELVRLAKEVKDVGVCVDFAHLFARSIGEFNGAADFGSALGHIKKELGASALKDMHIHFSGMNYGPKGERNHLVLQDKDNKFDYRGLISAFKKYSVKGIVISESPNIEEDALLMQKLWNKE